MRSARSPRSARRFLILSPDQSKTQEIYLLAAKVLFWAVFAGVVAAGFSVVRPLISWTLQTLTPFILGLILAYILHPIVEVVQHRLRLGRGMGIAVVAFGVMLALGGFLAVLVPILYQQIAAVLDGLAQAFSEGNIEKILEKLPYEKVPPEFFDFIENAVKNLKENFGALLKPVAQGSAGAVGESVQFVVSVFGWVGSVVATLVLSIVVTFYYLIDMGRIPIVVRRVIPGKHPERVWQALVKADRSVGGFLRGQLIDCICVGLLITILLLVIGPRKYAILIGFTAGAVNFIPYLGPVAGATPAVLWAIFASQLPFFGGADPATGVGEALTMTDRLLQLLLVFGGFGIVQVIDNFVFQPFIVGPHAALHPLAVMLALAAGSRFGISGMVLAVPLACVIKVFFVEFYWKDTRDFLEAPPPGGTPSP